MTSPPDRRPAAGPGGLRISQAVRLDFPSKEPFRQDEWVYFRDLLGSYGLTCPDERFAGGRTTFTEMIEQVLPRLGPAGDGYDMAVLAHATPDSQPGWAMPYLTTRVPVSGLSFAVGDQGVAAPFTALRLIDVHRRTEGVRRALLLVLDQSALVHDLPVPDEARPRGDRGVALVLDEAGRFGPVDAQVRTDVAPGEVGERMDAVVRAAPAPVTVVRGAGLAARWAGGPGEVLRADPGLPCTGLWSALADGLAHRQADGGGTVIAADYDESLRCLAICTVDVPPDAAG